MQLYGTVTPDAPLLVVALELEAVALRSLGLPMLVTGAGKVNAAIAVSHVLANAMPAEVLNLGTAGGLHAHTEGTHVISQVLEHDLDDATIVALAGVHCSRPIQLQTGGLILATGDRFIARDEEREALAVIADLVDMEGYAVAKAAANAGVPVRLVKHVSDRADESAAMSWTDTVTQCSYALADWVRTHV